MGRAALLQMASGPDPEGNLQVVRERLTTLVERGPDLVLTPENALVLGGPEDYRRVAEPLGEGPLQAEMAGLARRHRIWLGVGSFPIRDPAGDLRATLLLYGPDGALRAHYEKLHLFDVEVAGDRGGEAFRYRESDSYRPGDREVVVETPLGPMGLSICYDLRFPGLYAHLRELGAAVLAVPAAFTRATGEAHWELLLRARAVETQCHVLAAAQGGKHPDGRETWGHSMAVDPWGRVLAVAGPDDPGVVVDLDPAETLRIRASMPLGEHARHRARRGEHFEG